MKSHNREYQRSLNAIIQCLQKVLKIDVQTLASAKLASLMSELATSLSVRAAICDGTSVIT